MAEASPSLKICPVCGNNEFTNERVLWRDLIEQWKLSPQEVAYIDLQQGFCCASCKNSLRTMTLAAAVTRAFGSPAVFRISVATIRLFDNSPWLKSIRPKICRLFSRRFPSIRLILSPNSTCNGRTSPIHRSTSSCIPTHLSTCQIQRPLCENPGAF